MKRWKKVLLWIVVIVLLVAGLGMIFNEQIKEALVNHMAGKQYADLTVTKIENNKKAKTTYDFNSVKPLGIKEASEAAIESDVGAIGKMAIPSVKMYLPIMPGVSNSSLSQGGGTMKPNEKMGEGNYALAGHYMTDKGILFSPLKNIQKGAAIYITDMKNVYKYQVTNTSVVSENDVSVIDDVPGEKLITLVTCASAHEGEKNRIIVRGSLVSVTKADSQSLKVFTKTNQG